MSRDESPGDQHESQASLPWRCRSCSAAMVSLLPVVPVRSWMAMLGWPPRPTRPCSPLQHASPARRWPRHSHLSTNRQRRDSNVGPALVVRAHVPRATPIGHAHVIVAHDPGATPATLNEIRLASDEAAAPHVLTPGVVQQRGRSGALARSSATRRRPCRVWAYFGGRPT